MRIARRRPIPPLATSFMTPPLSRADGKEIALPKLPTVVVFTDERSGGDAAPPTGRALANRQRQGDSSRMEVSGAMLRITIRNEDSATSFVIEGKLAWPWVEELRKCWRRALSCHQPQSIRVDFTAMTFIDSRGRDLLVQMHRQGATLEGSGLMITALIEEIKQM